MAGAGKRHTPLRLGLEAGYLQIVVYKRDTHATGVPWHKLLQNLGKHKTLLGTATAEAGGLDQLGLVAGPALLRSVRAYTQLSGPLLAVTAATETAGTPRPGHLALVALLVLDRAGLLRVSNTQPSSCSRLDTGHALCGPSPCDTPGA